MPFIRSFSLNCSRQHPFPFNVPGVRFARNIALDDRITVFAGDNGCGKSTLLETIGLYLDAPLIGGRIGGRQGFEGPRALQPFLEIQQVRRPLKSFFFRAEDFSEFLYALRRDRNRNAAHLDELKGAVADSVIEEMNNNMNPTLKSMYKDYGDSMQAFSHGEAYLKIIGEHISDNGIYLLDEPEAALSPQKQLTLMAYLLDMLKSRNTQFIISTHSPILMGIPGARLYEIQEEGIQQVDFRDTEHYRITHSFLNNPEMYLRYL
ncbi:AAA family ATPase [Chitinophaga varians]|uniref:AAA family ATPase n=1 Tax=Chitinophaga varians TaxID=2202339 RepID=A0A847RWK1_9BACT|nr:AAA family ATPase [Chitinophaga varians]NLR67402.1 AAA family ATPase [Chitinophaga varians]